MEKNKVILNILNLILVLGLICLLPDFSKSLFELNPYSFNQIDLTTKHSIVNFFYNSYQSWQFDPIIRNFLNYFPSEIHYLVVFCYSSCFFFLGLFYYLDKSNKGYAFEKFNIFIVFLASYFLLWNIDLVFLSSLTWFPFFAYSIKLFFESRFKNFLLLALFSTLLIISANQLSILYFSISFLYFYNQKGIVSKSFNIIFCFSFLLLASFWILQFSSPEFYDYHTLSRFLIFDNIPGNSRPLFGPDSPVEFQNFDIQRSIFFLPISISLFCLIIFILIHKQARLCFKIQALTIVFVVLYLDITLNESLAYVLPIQAISLAIPHLFFIFFLSLFFLISYFMEYEKNIFAFYLLLLILCVSGFEQKPFSNGQIAQLKSNPNLYSNYSLFQKINSPSVMVFLENEGIDVLKMKRFENKRFKPIKDFQPEFQTTMNKDILRFAYDRRKKTRWKSGNGTQNGNEKISIKLFEPKKIAGLDLATHDNVFDYPRGLKISYLEKCDKADVRATYKPLKYYKDWPGTVLFTELGFPYYSNKSFVTAFFEPKQIQCFLIEQTKNYPKNDWSITEIKILSIK